VIQTLFARSKKASSRSTEVKILKRGDYYLTPFTLYHIDEVAENLSPESKREIILMGHTDIKQALYEMHECSNSYLARRNDDTFLMVGGLWYEQGYTGKGRYWEESPAQMFAMFSEGVKQNFHAIARGSKMLVNFFDQSEPSMTMTILSDYEPMLNWASWLGFEPLGVSMMNENKYVEFVRCNPNQKNVYDKALRPVKH
jgi:hypothetical protein